MRSLHGVKWVDTFEHFPALSKQVTIDFQLHSMKRNHGCFYSISSCKLIVRAEMHLVVGRGNWCVQRLLDFCYAR